MNYDELDRDEAEVEIMNQVGQKTYAEHRNEVIEPRDVLYWLDAFGDFSLAINCQGLPKDLPDDVVKAINEYDVLNDWHGKIEETSCPLCGREFYSFDFDAIHPVIDEYGDHHEYVEYLDDHAGYYWNAIGDEPMMCEHCRDRPNFSRMLPEPSVNEVRVFYGESDEFSRFTHDSGVIRWDFMWDMDYPKAIDLFNIRGEDGELVKGHEIASSFAAGSSSRNAMMERIGFRGVNVEDLERPVSGFRRFKKHAKNVLSGWATLDSASMTNEPTHPDLDFTYIIEGRGQAWVPKEHYEKFVAELVWQTFREASDYDRAEEWREEHDAILSFDWEAA